MDTRKPDLLVLILALMPAPLLWGLNGLYMKDLLDIQPSLFWLHDFLSFVVLPVFSGVVFIRYFNYSFADLGLSSNNRPASQRDVILQVIIACLIFWYVYRFAQFLGVKMFGNMPTEMNYGNILPEKGILHILGTLYFSLTAGFAEEIIFRGIPFAIICRYVATQSQASWFLVVTSISFALIHWENGPAELFATFAVGVAAAILYLRIRWLWPLIIAHFMTDFIEFI